MKRSILIRCLVFVVLLTSTSGCLRKTIIENESDIPTYSISSDIVNPPDEFLLLFPLVSYGEFTANINFKDNAVWEIQRISSQLFNNVKVDRSTGGNSLDLITSSTINFSVGLEGGVKYRFVANKLPSSNPNESYNLILSFKKTDKDYDTFSPKI